ncbi:MAG TPA: SOS response-associated peptidase, partial [Myxococcales bacterium]|nr:SOS response-associated peptidase [Myxococcales bacterium]
MCGRYTTPPDSEALRRRFRVDEVREPTRALYNVAPQTEVPVVVAQGGRRILGNVRWGLIPRDAKSLKAGPHPINARAETVASSRLFREPFERRRCLVVADSFFEWTPGEGGKRPFRIQLASGEPFAMAGLWDGWRDPAAALDAPWLKSCTIVTTEANALVAKLHDRMPVILAREAEDVWLDSTAGPELLLPLLRPYP